ncbi:MFS transporter [Ornithinimicrobium panacihumi]|uniref:MFS transporter n=1 Tax=Ornithinimicrobium panacihumi TaxID=2008449 RepID=UPI003F8BCFAB
MSTTTVTPAPQPERTAYQGNDKLLLGLVLAVLTFWLFAGTVGTVAPEILRGINTEAERISAQQMNLAVSITALFSGLFTVVMGGLADRTGRVRMAMIGLLAMILGNVLVVLAAGVVALPLLLVGRAVQGFAAACIMPSTLALVKTYWDGAGRQRAVSMWSIGSFGGAGSAAVFGGQMASNLGWRWIFLVSIVVCVVAIMLIRGTPESRVEGAAHRGFDGIGLVIFMITVLAMMIVLIFGKQLGWTNPITLALAVVAVVGITAFVLWERRQAVPFIDFALFRNTTFTGAVVSNFILNGTMGLLIVSQQMLQRAREPGAQDAVSAGEAGLLSIGYAIMIVAFIRVGEKLLQRFGPRRPMMWGSMLVGLTCLLLMPTWVMLDTYKVLAVVAYAVFGLGLAFYATPATDAALSNLPADQAGAGAGIFKMASSLGSAIGVAISLAIFTGLMGSNSLILGSTVTFTGVQDNVALRQAGMVVMIWNLVIVLVAILAIALTVPRGGGNRGAQPMAASAAPPAQLPPDEEKRAILERLSGLSVTELREAEKHALLGELVRLDPDELRRIVEARRR